MPWLVVLLVLIVAGMAVAVVVLKRRQDAPFRSFGEAIASAAQVLRKKPESISFRSSPKAPESPFDPAKEEAEVGNYKLVYDGITLDYQYDKSTEFLDVIGDEFGHAGVQYIQNDPQQVYLDNERIEDRHRYLEEYTGNMMTVRRLIRKHLKIEEVPK